jgi:mannosyltransferase
MFTNRSFCLPKLAYARDLQLLLLAVIFMLGAVLRFYKLGEWSLWIDEIFTIRRIQNQYIDLETALRNLPPHTNWVPTSFLLGAVSQNILGISPWSARLASALIGIATIPIIYFPIRRLSGPMVALVAVLLLAVSPWHLEWSQNARFYTGLLLFYFLAAYVFFMAVERDRPFNLLLFGILLVLAVGERFMAVFLLPVILLYLLLLAVLPIEKPAGFNRRNLILILTPGLGFALIELRLFLLTGSSHILGSIELVYDLPIDDPFRLTMFIAFNIGIPLMCLAAFAGIYLLLHKSRIGLFIVLNALVPIALLVLISPFYFTRDRYVFMVLPFWLILAAVAVKEIYMQAAGRRTLLAVGVLALLLADAAGANLIYYQINHGNRHDWNSAFALIQERSQPDDQFVTWWTEFGPYYVDREIISWEDVDPEFVIDSGQRFWFVLDEETIWGNGHMKWWIERNGELIDIKYLRTPGDANLHIYLFDPDR